MLRGCLLLITLSDRSLKIIVVVIVLVVGFPQVERSEPWPIARPYSHTDRQTFIYERSSRILNGGDDLPRCTPVTILQNNNIHTHTHKCYCHAPAVVVIVFGVLDIRSVKVQQSLSS